jgi:hypothetical protein
MPIFLMEGEKTWGKENITRINPMMQMIDIPLGRIRAYLKNRFFCLSEYFLFRQGAF